MADSEKVEREYRVVGKVQGVFYRAWTRDTARELGVEGTVRNRSDGSVEIHARGTAEVLEEFEKRLWDGSPAADVASVESFDSEARIPEGDFRVLLS